MRNYSEEVAAKIDEEVKKIISNSYAKTENKLKSHIDKLHAVAQYLFANEKMDSEQFIQIMETTHQGDRNRNPRGKRLDYPKKRISQKKALQSAGFFKLSAVFG